MFQKKLETEDNVMLINWAMAFWGIIAYEETSSEKY